MFLEQLVRLVGSLLELFIVLVLLAVPMIGIGLWSAGFPVAGMLIAGGAIWFIASAVQRKP